MKCKFILGVFTISIIFMMCLGCTQVGFDPTEKASLKDMDLHVIGIVDSVRKLNGYNGTGVISMKVLKSNIKYYDPRDSFRYYYCIIKNGYAEVYDGHASHCFVGDTLDINTNRGLISWTNKVKKDQQYTIWINTNNRFYDYIKNYYQKLK